GLHRDPEHVARKARDELVPGRLVTRPAAGDELCVGERSEDHQVPSNRTRRPKESSSRPSSPPTEGPGGCLWVSLLPVHLGRNTFAEGIALVVVRPVPVPKRLQAGVALGLALLGGVDGRLLLGLRLLVRLL